MLIFLVVSQFYITEAENEYVIKGNSAVMKCKIPSFVADFVQIEAWVDEEGVELWRNNSTQAYGTSKKLLLFYRVLFSTFSVL